MAFYTSDRDSQDLFVNIVEYRQAYNKALERSIKPGAQPYKTVTKKVDPVKVRMAKALICSSVLAFGVGIPLSKAAKKNEVKSISKEIASPIADNIHYTGNTDQEGNRIWYIDDYGVIEDFKSQQQYTIDEEIFSAYMQLDGKYQAKERLNKIVTGLTGLANFEEYLKSIGYYGNEKQWAKEMSGSLLEKYGKNKMDTLAFEESGMRGR